MTDACGLEVREKAMLIDAYRTELQDLLTGLIVHVPGKILNDKTGLLANIFGIAGFVLSVGIVVARVVTQRASGVLQSWPTSIGWGRRSLRHFRIASSINWLR